MPLELKQFDTAPGWLATLSDTGGPIALFGNTSSVKIAAKGNNTATTISEVATVVAENTFTATTTATSPTLTGVSSFTGIAKNSTLVGNGIPANAVVGDFNTTAATITMAVAGSISLANPTGTPINATASAIGESVMANRGQITYTPNVTDTGTPDVYATEFAIHWTAGGVTKVPNKASANETITIDADLLGPGE